MIKVDVGNMEASSFDYISNHQSGVPTVKINVNSIDGGIKNIDVADARHLYQALKLVLQHEGADLT